MTRWRRRAGTRSITRQPERRQFVPLIRALPAARREDAPALPARSDPPLGPEVILEFTAVGAVVRVSAMDPRTLTEVVVQGPAVAGRAALQRLALAKLAWVLRRQPRAEPHDLPSTASR
jgi:hypothetical protein